MFTVNVSPEDTITCDGSTHIADALATPTMMPNICNKRTTELITVTALFRVFAILIILFFNQVGAYIVKGRKNYSLQTKMCTRSSLSDAAQKKKPNAALIFSFTLFLLQTSSLHHRIFAHCANFSPIKRLGLVKKTE